MVRPNCDCKYNRKPKLVELQLFLKRAVFYEMKKSNNDLGKFSIKSTGPWAISQPKLVKRGLFLNAVPNVPFTVCVEISIGIVLKSETGNNQN